ncbi:hypothetical protein BJ508DRAFT_310514 [Ascobolus immersus RN42]|uniref:Uncharacterized protein n=1 Tax=Ascobolus immersus RN42 TaxID=1160509 RepID=A0A3N4HVK8_ASCIM|nr:hypothetical protein BJ508DRAFT_310514 [Ascobolus immersus RN42]
MDAVEALSVETGSASKQARFGNRGVVVPLKRFKDLDKNQPGAWATSSKKTDIDLLNEVGLWSTGESFDRKRLQNLDDYEEVCYMGVGIRHQSAQRSTHLMGKHPVEDVFKKEAGLGKTRDPLDQNRLENLDRSPQIHQDNGRHSTDAERPSISGTISTNDSKKKSKKDNLTGKKYDLGT